jgi:hypothetical protein
MCGGAANQGFTGTKNRVAPPSGLDLPDRWVLKRRSGSGSMTEHPLAPIRLRKTPAETQSALHRNLNPLSASHKNRGFGRKSPPRGEQSATRPQDLDLK